MKSRFNFYEIVKVKETIFTSNHGISGLKGAVLGMAEDENHKWGYAVHIYNLDEVWDLPEECLESTGEFTSREEFYDGSYIHVKVNSNIGKGEIED
ncbi:Imm31 family immunity protein [Aquiflexum gelatinilyticum]|uniref:Imm31 family immunity protein n=1 Tax=Aquiflexum gelatinilyticum TaxID=2961943 RepID=UPI00216A1F2C|nr:Imm31 family immunity protein [Aquiflexum gelatinilyticum]MCS4433148.1 Imm31 family immunity protein [Aquiflexum gelatinilyticum]